VNRKTCLAAQLCAVIVALTTSKVVQAECHAKNLDVAQITAVVGELNDSTSNMAVLKKAMTDPLTADPGGHFAQAIQLTDRASVEGTMFAGYLIIYSRLTHDADRKSTDEYISNAAKTIRESSTAYADHLTLVASGTPRYADEIRQARDRIRKMAAIFLCAADAPAK
jgi:hypothetical protein